MQDRGRYVKDFSDTKNKILSSDADLILMDINIPGINGEMLLQEIRKESAVPVIMVTSRTTEIDEVLSMSYGADDYITKPYNPTILLLRISAILRRTQKTTDALHYNNAMVNISKGTITEGDRELTLTKNEMIIFQLLLNNRRVLSQEMNL